MNSEKKDNKVPKPPPAPQLPNLPWSPDDPFHPDLERKEPVTNLPDPGPFGAKEYRKKKNPKKRVMDHKIGASRSFKTR